jgi:hypothetical protein
MASDMATSVAASCAIAAASIPGSFELSSSHAASNSAMLWMNPRCSSAQANQRHGALAEALHAARATRRVDRRNPRVS